MADYLRRFDIRTFLLCQATDSRRRPSAAKIAAGGNPDWRRHYTPAASPRRTASHPASTTDAPVTWNEFRHDESPTVAVRLRCMMRPGRSACTTVSTCRSASATDR